MADIEANDQDSLSAEEQAQLNEMETSDKAAPAEPAPAAKKAKAPAAKVDAPAPKTGETEGEETDGAEAEGKPKGKGGPLSPDALAAVREERKEKAELKAEMARQRAEHDATLAKAMERFETVLKTFAPKEEAPKEAELPDRDIDPVGFLEAVMKKTGESLEQVTKRLDAADAERDQGQQQTENQKVVTNIITQATVKEKEFLTETPDYWAASEFLLKSRHDELEEMGYTEPQRNAIIMQEKVSIAAQALANGKNPAAVVYGIAKKRGYVKADKAAEGEGEEEVAAEVETPEAKSKAAAARLKNVDEGQKASASLSDLGGKGPSNLTAARLLEMTDAEFATAMSTKEGRALMGQ